MRREGDYLWCFEYGEGSIDYVSKGRVKDMGTDYIGRCHALLDGFIIHERFRYFEDGVMKEQQQKLQSVFRTKEEALSSLIKNTTDFKERSFEVGDVVFGCGFGFGKVVAVRLLRVEVSYPHVNQDYSKSGKLRKYQRRTLFHNMEEAYDFYNRRLYRIK